MRLIDKSALVAEIKERIKTYNKGYANGDDSRADALEVLLHDIDTLEVKEVDLEKEIKEEYLKRRCYGGRDNMLVILNEPQFNKIAKHFFELGLKAQRKSVSIQNIDEVLKELGVDPYSREAKMIEESYYVAMDKLLKQKGE